MNGQTVVLPIVFDSSIIVLITSILNLRRTLHSLLNPNSICTYSRNLKKNILRYE